MKYDITITRSGFAPSTHHDLDQFDAAKELAGVFTGAALAVNGGDQEAKISIVLRPAKETKYEVWCSMDAGEAHETTFTSFDLAKTHADALWEAERSRYETTAEMLSADGIGFLRHYYVKQRRGRAKSTLVYKAWPK